jgi:lysophospholipase L1-like esterase
VPLELVANLGVNGYSSADLIRYELPTLAGLRPGFVSLLIGVNDVVRGVPLDRYGVNVQQILEAILQQVPQQCLVVVSTPDYTRTPAGADFGDPAEQSRAIKAANAAMAVVCDVRGIEFVDISEVADLVDVDRSLVARDGLHPSGAQYARWVELISPVVRSLFSE